MPLQRHNVISGYEQMFHSVNSRSGLFHHFLQMPHYYSGSKCHIPIDHEPAASLSLNLFVECHDEL